MHRLCIALFSLALTANCQSGGIRKISSACPVKATQIKPRVYAFRLYTAGEEGWRPGSKMALDLSLMNDGEQKIAAMSFQISAPRQSQITSWDDYPVNLEPGKEATIYYPNDNRLIDLYGGYSSVTVTLKKIRYSDGEIGDFECDLGSAPIPPPFKPIKPTTASRIYPIGGEVSPPRVLEEHAMDTRQVPHLCSRSEVLSDPQVVCCIPKRNNSCAVTQLAVNLTTVVDTDGSPREIKVESGTLGGTFDQKAIETLSTWNFAPAMIGDTPVATRVRVPFVIYWYGARSK